MNLMNPITNEQMALKYTHICLFKVKITNLKNIQVRPQTW